MSQLVNDPTAKRLCYLDKILMHFDGQRNNRDCKTVVMVHGWSPASVSLFIPT